ncbi:MAG: tetratricopeptide repeat protein [Pseudomonadota bacterium]
MTPALLASLYAQAGNSYILANQPSHAIAPFTQALDQVVMTSPEAADISIDRARAAALTGDFDAAFEDLTTALGINAKDVDALLYRASAARQTQRYDVAKQDIQTLLDLRPDLPQAWLERGQLAIVMQKQDLARQSFIRTLELEDVGRVAETARYLLETLSLTP